jgi:hypothetical protein
MKKITEIAKVIRSKNCSPFELTLDIICRHQSDYEQLKARQAITAELIADRYGVSGDEVGEVIYFDPARAIKVTMRRPVPSGSPGDTDVYGAQQHAPLLGLEFDL